MTYEEVIKHVAAENQTIPARDKRHQEVEIRHLDGSYFKIRNAIKRVIEQWTIVYSEHHRPLVFFTEDLEQPTLYTDDGK